MVKIVELKFKNQDARPTEIKLLVQKSKHKQVAQWYASFYQGDQFEVFVGGVKQPLDRNGYIK